MIFEGALVVIEVIKFCIQFCIQMRVGIPTSGNAMEQSAIPNNM